MVYLTLLSLVEALVVLVPVLLAVAWTTLVERRVLAAMQRRVGPNVVGYYGLLQPFADALKLLTKEVLVPLHASRSLFFLAPALSLMVACLGWAVLPLGPGLVLADLELGVLYTLALSSVGVYGVLLTGWASNNAFGFLGGLRSTSMMISYELVLGTSVLTVILVGGSFQYSVLCEAQLAVWYGVPLLPVAILFGVSAVYELNRTPADLAEGESELVAGFFVEASASPFVSAFLAEYINIVMMSTLLAVLYLGGYAMPAILPIGFVSGASVVLGLKACIGVFGIVWLRATLPRQRFDTLMAGCWAWLLPLAIACLLFVPSALMAFDALA